MKEICAVGYSEGAHRKRVRESVRKSRSEK
jgi:hypothetical protein